MTLKSYLNFDNISAGLQSLIYYIFPFSFTYRYCKLKKTSKNPFLYFLVSCNNESSIVYIMCLHFISLTFTYIRFTQIEQHNK